MIRVALKGLLGRKLRTSLTAIAIVLGVAMVAGTFMLTDSIDKAFGSIFTDVRKGSSAVISGKTAFDIASDAGSTAPTLDASLLAKVRGLPEVEAAEGSVNGQAQLIGKNGKAIVYGGAPNLGFSIANGASRFNPLTLVEGSWPKQSDVVIDESTAKKEHFKVGQTVGVQAEGRRGGCRISGFVAVRLGLDDRRRDARRLRPADSPGAVRQARPAGRDRGRREAGRVGRAARPRAPGEHSAHRAGEDGAAAGARTMRPRRTASSRSCAASCSRSAGSRSSSAAS